MNASTARQPAPVPLDLAAPAVDELAVLRVAVVLAIAAACASMVSLQLADPDLWGHVRYGQDWIADGTLHRTATHTYTAQGYRWVNHENLAELAMATGCRTIGIHGLLVAKCVLGMGILAAMAWVAAKRGVPILLAWMLLWLIARNLQAFFPLRPQLLSFALCAVALVALDRAFRDWSQGHKVCWKALAALPPLMAVWVNSHGAFVAGLCIVGTLLAGRMLELLVARPEGALKKSAGLASVGIGCLAATLLNPYGLGMHRWLMESLGQPRPEITEWLPPMPGSPVFWPLVVLTAVAAASISATRAKRDWAQIAILALVAWQAWGHLRHIAFFALLCGFWLPVHAQSALARLRPRGMKLDEIAASRTTRWAALTAVAAGGLLHGSVLWRNLSDLPVPRANYPVDAFQYMAHNRLTGKLVVSFNWAQYAIAAFADEGLTVGFDGRFRTCYPQEVVDMHFDFLLGENGGARSRAESSGPVDGTRVLSHGSPDLVLADRRYEHAVGVMQAESQKPNPEWVLLYRDRIAELWGRASRYNDPAGASYIPASDRVLDPAPRTGGVTWPALPRHTTAANHAA